MKTTKTSKAVVAPVTIAGIEFLGVMLPDGSYGITVSQASTILGITASKRNQSGRLRRLCTKLGLSYTISMEYIENSKVPHGILTLEDFIEIKTHLDIANRVTKKKSSSNTLLYTYLITDVERGVCKIGQSTKPEDRLINLQTGYPYPLTLAKVVPSLALPEKEVHNLLNDLRLNGEWFKLTPLQYVLFHEAVSNNIPPCSGAILSDRTGIKMGLRSNGKDPFIETASLEKYLKLPYGMFSGSEKAYLIGAEDLDSPSSKLTASTFLVMNNNDAVELSRSLDCEVTHTIVATFIRIQHRINEIWNKMYLKSAYNLKTIEIL